VRISRLERFISERCYCGYLTDFTNRFKGTSIQDRIPALCIWCKLLDDYYRSLDNQEAAKGGVNPQATKKVSESVVTSEPPRKSLNKKQDISDMDKAMILMAHRR